MAERSVNCYKCGGDGHYARNCPQSKSCLMQTRPSPPAPATTAVSPDISPASALRPARNEEVVTEIESVGTTEIEETEERTPESATTVASQDTSRGTAESQKKEKRAERTSATTAASTGTFRGSVLMEGRGRKTSATTAMRLGTWQETAPTSEMVIVLSIIE